MQSQTAVSSGLTLVLRIIGVVCAIGYGLAGMFVSPTIAQWYGQPWFAENVHFIRITGASFFVWGLLAWVVAKEAANYRLVIRYISYVFIVAGLVTVYELLITQSIGGWFWWFVIITDVIFAGLLLSMLPKKNV